MVVRHVFNRSFLLLVILCVASWSLPAQAVIADKASDDFNLGVAMYRSQRWDQASQTFDQFLQDFPEHPRAYVARLYFAMSLSSQNKYSAAREQFVKVIEADSNGRNIADARYRLGECSYYLKEYKVAVTQLNEYLDKHAGHSLNNWAKLYLGDSYVSLTEFDRAEQTLKPLLAPSEPPALLADARLSLGRALEGLKRPDEAAEQYVAVIAMMTPEAAKALHRLGGIQYTAKKYSDAAASYDQIVAEHPTHALVSSARLGAGMSWYRAGELDKAIERFKTVPRESGGATQAALMTAVALRQLKKYEESRPVFAEALKLAGESTLAPEILFEQAQMERAANEPQTAAQLFEDAADRFPQSSRVPDCLFNAAELQLELNQGDHALKLWNRLSKDYPEQIAKPREQVLSGRMSLAQNRVDEAIATLEKAVSQITDMSQPLAMVARYYLVRSLFKAKKFDQVVVLADTMLETLKTDPRTELHGTFVMAALSSLEMKQYDSVLKFADLYLPLSKDAKQKYDAIAARSIALCRLSKFADATTGLQTLVADNPDDAQTWTAVLTSAEAALEMNAAAEAEQLFRMASKYEKNPAVKEAGETGVAWSQFRAKRYPEAEASFQRLVQDYPASADAAEILFMMGRSVEEQGDATRTVAVYSQVFDTLTKDKAPAAAGDEENSPGRYILDAGQQVARGLQRLKKLDDSDKAWERLVKHFPNAKTLDRILDEWAWMNASESRFERSDEIHKQLLDKFPESPFAGQARLSLAESLLDVGRTEESLREMNAIVADARYGATEKERAQFHVVQIHVTGQNWKLVKETAEMFLMNYGNSVLAPEVRLYLGDAQLQLQLPTVEEAALAATATLTSLRDDVVSGQVASQPWVDHIWIVMAEAALASKNYDKIDALETELATRSKQSREAFKLAEIQGKRWKQQAPPNFEKSRQYFSIVLTDATAEGTETAARCQYQMAETFLLEQKLDQAIKEYYKVVHLHNAYPAIGSEAMYKAALCHAELGDNASAIRDLKDLVTKFPEAAIVPQAKAELEKLNAGSK